MITGGQSLVRAPPTFSNDAKKLLVCTGLTVSVFSTTTGMLVTELEGHEDRVTSVIVVPATEKASKFMSYCWTSSLDGTIRYWDFAAPQLIKRVKVQLPIHSMVIPNISNAMVESNRKTSHLYAVISVEDISKSTDQHKALRGQIQIYNLNTTRRIGGLLAETRNPEIITISNSGEFLGIQNKRKLHIWRIPLKDFRFDNIKKVKLHHTKTLSVLAFHPTERIVAGGDVTGRILIWRDFGRRKFLENTRVPSTCKKMDEEERPGVRGNDDADSCSTWHWHPSSVKFLFFSSDGAYLYSGGKEGVLVVWQLDTGKKKFKPRLGSPLLYYKDSPDPSLSCISCADNQIHLLKMPTMEILKSIAGIKLPFSFPDIYEGIHGGFAFDQTSKLVAVRTENYCIQFFSLLNNLEVSQIQVCERNYQPVDDVTVFVAFIALSQDASMMGTVEVKLSEEKISGLVSLKFWARGSQTGEYNLSTVVYEPHSDAGISALAFRPKYSTAVTSAFGGDFKVWVHSPEKQQTSEKVQRFGWSCQSVGSYKKKPMTAAAFSADGSVLAVAAETVVTLWDPDSNVLVAVIGDTLTPIVSLSFIGKSEYVVSLSWGSKPQLAVWNLSQLSMHWSYKLFSEAVACTEDGSQFAILALPYPLDEGSTGEQGVILLFNVEDPTPVATWSVKKVKRGGLAFLPADPSVHTTKSTDGTDHRLLAYINYEHEFIVFDPLGTEENNISRSVQESHAPNEESVQYGYASIYGELPEFNLKRNEVQEIPFVPSEKPWETIFSGSSHVLPPLTKLCSAFLESLLEKRPAIKD